MSTATTLLTYIPDHSDKAVAALMWQFREASNIKALAEALAAGVQKQEDELFDIIMSVQFDTAVGVNLDIWGNRVGERRDGLTDFEYRPFIRGRILANRSNGKTNDLIRVFQEITAPSGVAHINLFPAGFQLTASRSEYMTDRVATRVGFMMRSIKPAGISMDLIETNVGHFGFDEDPTALPYDVGIFSRAL